MNVHSRRRAAREAAIRRLRDAHPDEWERYHAEERERYGLNGETTGRTLAKCRRCGGDKDRRGPGVRYCTTCSKLNRKEAKQRYNQKPSSREKYAAWARKRRKAKPKRVPKPPPVKVPSEVRQAWAKAHPNSIIRRRYPTTQALQEAARRGEFTEGGKVAA